ncbi:MAG: HK97 gp10 family phage protein [Actinomycetaceae bacterium]
MARWNRNYRMNNRGFRDLAQDSGIGDAMIDAAERGKAWAEANSPVKTGRYKESFEVVKADVPGGHNNEQRAGAELRNTAPHAHMVEGRHQILRRATNIIEGEV